VEVARRDTMEKQVMQAADLADKVEHLLGHIQDNLYRKALTMRESSTRAVDTYDEFKVAIEEGGFILAHWDGTSETENRVKDETKATIRCIPLNGDTTPGVCMVTGRPSERRVIFARAY
jgi:prolyl-tRNA synthetase